MTDQYFSILAITVFTLLLLFAVTSYKYNTLNFEINADVIFVLITTVINLLLLRDSISIRKYWLTIVSIGVCLFDMVIYAFLGLENVNFALNVLRYLAVGVTVLISVAESIVILWNVRNNETLDAHTIEDHTTNGHVDKDISLGYHDDD